jgi:hypothetical protein
VQLAPDKHSTPSPLEKQNPTRPYTPVVEVHQVGDPVVQLAQECDLAAPRLPIHHHDQCGGGVVDGHRQLPRKVCLAPAAETHMLLLPARLCTGCCCSLSGAAGVRQSQLVCVNSGTRTCKHFPTPPT